MLNLKKTALAVIALGSTAAFAGTMGPVCSAVNVTVPCENTAWDFGGRALYLQPSSDIGFAETTAVQAANSVTTGANPTWGWGFQLEGSYHYSTGNDFNLNWYHFRNTATNTLATGVAFADAADPFVTAAISAGSYTKNSPAWDQVNMEFGQHVDFGENKFVRLHGGMNFSRVGNNVTNQFLGAATAAGAATTNLLTTINTVYNGFGPRVGMDLNYEWGNGVGVYATGALSVLAGSSKGSVNIQQTLPTADAGNFTNGFNRSAVIPELDAKLGAMYTYAMAQGDLSLDLGWVWAHYTNALLAAGMAGAEAERQDFRALPRDFGIQGLYFGMKWVGNVA